ncbi:MAG: AMP-binding protein [Hydrococcus sp. C42_A2020_068]|nr:AMP-binding protein [Hydrococcus sp. C42_A2020_068]
MLRFDKTYKAPPNSGKAILGRTLPSLLDEGCDRAPNNRAFNQWREAGWESLSNHAFRSAAEEVALGLLELPLEKGDRVALLMHSDVNFCLVDMGCLLANLIDVPIDLTQTIENIIFIMQHSEAKALVISNLDLLNQIVPYLWDASTLKIAIIADVPTNWQQVRSQRLSDRNEATQETSDIKEIPASACLVIPQLLHHPRVDRPCPEFPPCIQLLSLEEVRAKGRNCGGETHRQQLRESLEAKMLATIIYIPGSTGQLQGVMLTHENLSASSLATFTSIPDLALGAKEVALSFLPLTHVFARTFVYGHMNYGHSIYFSSPNRVMKHLMEVRPTLFATVPLLLEKVYHHILERASKQSTRSETVGKKKRAAKRKYSTAALQRWLRARKATKRHFGWLFSRFSVFKIELQFLQNAPIQNIVNWALNLAKQYELGRQPKALYALQLKVADRLVFSKWRAVFGGRLKYLISGGAALKAGIANLLAAAGIVILQGYGLTETSGAVACNRGQFNRAGTVGVPLPGVEFAIAEDKEILVRGPCVMQGYYKNPEATQKVLDEDGWLHTGDLGEFGEDGFLKITGLKKSPFKLSTGKYVTPEPLEGKLEKSPLVSKAIAVGAERKFCAMLIFPNLDALHEQAQAIGLNLPTEALLKHPCILALYQALVDEANCHLPYWSMVKRFSLVNATLSVENEMLTPTGEVRRAKVVEAFAKEIDALYEDVRDAGTHKRTDAELESVNENDIPAIMCPPVAPVTCPVYARSLNHY